MTNSKMNQKKRFLIKNISNDIIINIPYLDESASIEEKRELLELLSEELAKVYKAGN